MESVLKSWGGEDIYVNNELYCFKELAIGPSKHTSIHKHITKDETLIVQAGILLYEVYEMDVTGILRFVSSDRIVYGGSVRVVPGTIHRLVNGSTSEYLVIREVSTHHDDKDTIRYSENLVFLTPVKVL